MSCVQFTVNGKKCVVDCKVPRDTSLNVYIRYFMGLPGTKAMCREGGCGSCIVMVRSKRLTSGAVETFSVNSCLVLVFSCHGWEITTIEDVGNRLDGYSEVQKRVVHFNATQCGYCTPGWVMHLTSLLDKYLTMAELENSFGSNTCRCTGYRPVLDTIKSFAIDASPQLCQKIRDIEDVEVCKKTNEKCESKCSVKSIDSDWTLIEEASQVKLEDDKITLDFGGGRYYYKVYDEESVFEVFDAHGVDSYLLIDGDTAKGIVENFEYAPLLIDISGVKTLKNYYFDQNFVLGANISIEDCITIFQTTAKEKSEFAYLEEFAKHLKLVAHIPVRKIGSLAGNLTLKRQIRKYQSDIFLLFEAVGATLTIRSKSSVDNDITLIQFLDYDMTGKLITKIKLPPLNSFYIFRSYKIMPRHQNALGIVNSAFLGKMNSTRNVLDNVTMVYGGISDTFVHASKTENFLGGKNVFENTVLQAAIKILSDEVQPINDPPEPSPECRKKLAIGLFYRFLLNIAPPNLVHSLYRSGGTNLERPVSKSRQDYQTNKELYPLNQPLPKLEAFIQSGGEARYSNDIPPMKNEVFGAFVLSTIHVGEIDAIDASEVLKIDGVITILTAKDIPGINSFGFPGIQLQTQREEILANSSIKFYGQPVAILVAKSEDLASKAAKKVKVTYKNVSSNKPVLTIDEAKNDSRRYVPGDSNITPTGKGTDVKKVIKGVYEIGAQYHYYIEPLTCVVIPVDDKLEVHDAGQWMDLTQICIAKTLNIKESDVLVKVRRVGGGFGGKISRNVQVATACALVAKKLDVPCRFILPIQTNLTIAGRRLPTQCNYEVGVNDTGKVQYLTASITEDVGCSTNEDILSYTVGGFHNCYDTSYYDVKTANVLTDLPSNTFARAPGTAEGISSIEQIMEHISYEVEKDATNVRLTNMRTDDNDLPELIETLKQKSNYDQRVQDIESFNQANRWKKKSIRISVMSFPVEYNGNYSAMVSIYRGDGSVTVTTGGIEMGQGVNTKAAQVCAYELNIPVDKVSVLPSVSFVAANNVFSGSSIVSESVSYAIIKCCKMLKDRLKPVRDKMPDATWEEIVFEGGNQQIDLVAEYMMTDTEEDLKSYSAFAVVILEIQLDVLTGRFEIERVDILEDVGLSANPQVDVGQVEGGYIQGIGYYTCEKLVFDKDTGKLLTNRSLNYHVPLCLDIPIEFNVNLRYNSKNPYGVLSSKTCGEMGICTAQGILHAIRKAIYESRHDSGYETTEWININVPNDTESILKALDVKYSEFLITKP